MSPHEQCPRFSGCSAPICPLDPNWRCAQHLPHERVCGLLCELVKADGPTVLAKVVTPEQLATLVEECPSISAKWSAIRSGLMRASQSGSRIERARTIRLQQVKVDPAGLVFLHPHMPDGHPSAGASSEVPA